MKIISKTFLSASIGTLIEYYDYALFSIFFPIMAPVFIPAESSYQALTKGFWVLGLTAIARPFGGLFFGYIGDHFGRKPALLMSLYGISFATLMIGLMPGYDSIGIWGLIFITFGKAIQIFCFAGEMNGAGIYALEHVEKQRQSYVGSVLSATTWTGSLIASLVGVLLTAHFMPAWSWRLAFVLGGVMALLGMMARKHLPESPELTKNEREEYPLKDLFFCFPRELFAGLWIGGFVTVPCTTVLIFINPVLMTKGFFSAQELMWIQSLLTLFAIGTLLISGFMADRQYSPFKNMTVAALLLCVLSYPLLWIVDQGDLLGILFASAIFIIINEWGFGPTHAYLKSLFPVRYRYRACSMSFAGGMALFGALTPICERYLLEATDHFTALTLWLVFVGAGMFLSMHSVLRLQKKHVKTVSA